MADVGEVTSISRTAVLRERYRARLPESLDDLTGPGHGIVQLPAHIASLPEGYFLLFVATAGALRTPLFNLRITR